jgi:electron transport complex protein RnfC
LNELTKEEIRNLIKEAGIVGMGGAGFPTHVKLTPKDDNAIDFVIVNCAECEPYLTSDYRRMIEEPEKLVGGLKAVLRLFENAKGILAVEDNKPDCIQALNKLVKDEPNIKVVSLKTKYPQGAERQLIFASTGRAINSSMLPADAGCVVNNVDTVAAIYMAVFEGKPLMNRTVTITGEAINNPCNLMVCTGTIYRELIEEAGGFKEEPSKIISGGPMMGFAIYNIDVPVTKTSSALLCLTEDDVMTSKTTACINCGKCVEVCPGRIIPSRLADMANRHDEAGFIKLNGMECCACGCCSFICPAKRQLTQSIKSMRQLVLANVKKK